MRILRLDLMAFGPFTGKSLDFGTGAGLHIVHGPNEAGKSSSLRGLHCLLYGFSATTSDDFHHTYPKLRVGGLFESAGGTRLECIRRKGNSKTLRGPDDVDVCDESQLIQMLGGVDGETYRRRFGIDYQELRRGGQALVQGKGDLGETLFAAGTGVGDIKAIQQQFEKDAESLFKFRGSNPRINQSVSELDRIRKEIRELQLPTTQWTEHDREKRKAEKRQREIDEELTRREIEQSRLDRIRQTLPLLSSCKSLGKELADLSSAPLLPESFEGDRRDATKSLSHATLQEAAARQEMERLDAELRSVSVPKDLLKHQTAISDAHTNLGSYRKAARDRPGLVANRDAARKKAEELLRDLRQLTTLETTGSLQLPKGKRRTIQDLSSDCKVLTEKQLFCEQSLRGLDRKVLQADETVQRLPQQRDLSELDRTMRQVQKCGDLDSQLSGVRAELENLNAKARVALARLTLFHGTLEELETLPSPSVETIDRIELLLSEADKELRRRQDKVEELIQTQHDLQSRLDALQLAGEVPTELELDAIRQRRNAGWELILKVWEGALQVTDSSVVEFIKEFAKNGDLREAYFASVVRTDTIADRLRRESDRVAQQAKLTSDLQNAQRNFQTACDDRIAAEEQREQIWLEWQALWNAADIDPLPPREMRSWQNKQQELMSLAEEKRTCEAELQRLVHQIDSLRDNLNRCLETLEQPVITGQIPLSITLDACQGIAEEIRNANQRRVQLELEREKLRGQRAEDELAANEAKRRLDEWRTEWAEAVTILGLDGRATPTEANAVIESVDELHTLHAESTQLNDRIRGIDDDAENFKQSVRLLLEQVAPELLAVLMHSVDQSVADLVDRLNRAVQDQTKVDEWQKQLANQKSARDNAAGEITRWRKSLTELCLQAGCQSPDELPLAVERSSKRRNIESELHRINQRLCELAAGVDLGEWITASEQFDPDRVQVDMAGLDEEILRLQEEKQRVSESLGAHRNELSRMDGSARAADAQLQAECLLATIRQDAEEYIRKRLASTVLSHAIDRFRESSQGPVLSRASDLFSTLTQNSFSGLRADSDDGGKPVIVGVRPDGQTVNVSAGMSEGTCDQIYLALRIALLESSLDGREPLPFIVDDILVMYDNERAAAALQVLSEFSRTTQVILFTHHDHLVDIAQSTLPECSLHVVGL